MPDLANNRGQAWTRSGLLEADRLAEARAASRARDVDIEKILVSEYGVNRGRLLDALSAHYNVPGVAYDERMPVPVELLRGLDAERLSLSQWFPVMRQDDMVVVAANRPDDPVVHEEVRRFLPGYRYAFRVALARDVQRFIQDFLNDAPGRIIGTERTGLAFWRNTMAQWRTRLACYRTDLAEARTRLALLRWGLGIITVGNGLLRLRPAGPLWYLYGAMIAAGLGFTFFGLMGYLRLRRSLMQPSRHHTVVEVTTATLHFLQDYHLLEKTGQQQPTRSTMLARLADLIAEHCTILYPVPASRERTQLARERNVLAAQRTVAGCHRTVYARGRTGLAFIRTGVSFASVGLGFMKYFAWSPGTLLDLLLVAAGVLMAVDGIRWYAPLRPEASNLPRCPENRLA